jgi:hypothetical protein
MTDFGKIIFFSIYVGLCEIGKHLEEHPKTYSCPRYCEVDHEHIDSDSLYVYTEKDTLNG